MRLRGFLVRLFLMAVGLNFIWEMAQMPLYRNMPFDRLDSWLFCFQASLGDGVITLIILAAGALLYRSFRWFTPLSAGKVVLLIAAGSLIAIGVELHALAVDRWAYSAIMPVMPVLKVGVSPVVQLAVLPWLSMRAAVQRESSPP